jgi:hypothetical protein
MPILNYTTEVPIEKTIGEIQKCLAAHGAAAILTEYGPEGYIVALSFKINFDGQFISFRLPTDWEPILKILEREKKVPRRLVTKEQALRVAWRIIKVWVDAQCAIIETKMVKAEQVFLPYAITKNNETLYENIIKSGMLLPPGNE